MHFCFFIQTNVRIIDFVKIKIGLTFHKIFKFMIKSSYEVQSKQILKYECCEGEKWKKFDGKFLIFFPPVRIEYLHENIQGKEVKNGKFKKRANCKKKFLRNNYKIIFIIFVQNISYFFFNKLLFPPEYYTPKTPSRLENILRNSPKKFP